MYHGKHFLTQTLTLTIIKQLLKLIRSKYLKLILLTASKVTWAWEVTWVATVVLGDSKNVHVIIKSCQCFQQRAVELLKIAGCQLFYSACEFILMLEFATTFTSDQVWNSINISSYWWTEMSLYILDVTNTQPFSTTLQSLSSSRNLCQMLLKEVISWSVRKLAIYPQTFIPYIQSEYMCIYI